MYYLNQVKSIVEERNLKDRIIGVLNSFNNFDPSLNYSTVYCIEEDKFFPYMAEIDYGYYCINHFITFEYYCDGEIYYGCNFGNSLMWYIKATASELLMKVDKGVFDNADKRRTQQKD